MTSNIEEKQVQALEQAGQERAQEINNVNNNQTNVAVAYIGSLVLIVILKILYPQTVGFGHVAMFLTATAFGIFGFFSLLIHRSGLYKGEVELRLRKYREINESLHLYHNYRTYENWKNDSSYTKLIPIAVCNVVISLLVALGFCLDYFNLSWITDDILIVPFITGCLLIIASPIAARGSLADQEKDYKFEK